MRGLHVFSQAPRPHPALQRVGVPQGSVLSSLACALHYGEHDLRHLARFLPRCDTSALDGDADKGGGDKGGGGEHEGEGASGASGDDNGDSVHSTLMRLVDDSMCVSTSREVCEGYLGTTCRGFSDYGGAVNDLSLIHI